MTDLEVAAMRRYMRREAAEIRKANQKRR